MSIHNFQSFSSARITRFGRGATVVRSNEPLTIEQIAAAAPSVVADAKHTSRSERYTYIPTSDVLAGLAKEGFRPYEVRQGGSKDDEKRGYTKHLIRLRHDGSEQVGDSKREVVLINSHDGTSSYQLMHGIFRMVCSNGLIAADENTIGVKVPHKGDVVGQVIEGAYRVIEEGKAIDSRVADMRQIELRPAEQDALAEAATALRWDETSPVEARQLLDARRRDDVGSDLWRTFNRVQENLVRGGVHYIQRDEQGRRVARRQTRPVNGIDGNVGLNRALWVLAARMQELKAA
jgi:hypothetical protein